MLKNLRTPLLYFGLPVMCLMFAGCETVDQTHFDNYECKDLKVYSEVSNASSNGAYGQYSPPSEDKLIIDQRREEPLETLLNSSRSSAFKRESALRKAYKDKGC